MGPSRNDSRTLWRARCEGPHLKHVWLTWPRCSPRGARTLPSDLLPRGASRAPRAALSLYCTPGSRSPTRAHSELWKKTGGRGVGVGDHGGERGTHNVWTQSLLWQARNAFTHTHTHTSTTAWRQTHTDSNTYLPVRSPTHQRTAERLTCLSDRRSAGRCWNAENL